MKYIFRTSIFAITILVLTTAVFSQSSSSHGPRSRLHNKIVVELVRDKSDAVSLKFEFRGDGSVENLPSTELSVQGVAVKRTGDGRVDDVTNVGSPARLQLPSIRLAKDGEEPAAQPAITIRALPGVDAVNVVIRKANGETVKQFYLRIPAGEGITTGEIRF